MKPILIFIAGVMLAINAKSQSQITGPVTDASGLPASCTLSIQPTSVPGASTTVINYIVNGGDLTGSISGYGASRLGPLRNAPLTLLPGTYSAFMSCLGGFGSGRRQWIVPAFSVSLQSLNAGTLHYAWSQVTSTWMTSPGAWTAQ